VRTGSSPAGMARPVLRDLFAVLFAEPLHGRSDDVGRVVDIDPLTLDMRMVVRPARVRDCQWQVERVVTQGPRY
jgi:hypothetical protein